MQIVKILLLTIRLSLIFGSYTEFKMKLLVYRLINVN